MTGAGSVNAPDRAAVVELLTAALRQLPGHLRSGALSEALTAVWREDDRAARVRDVSAADAVAELGARKVVEQFDELLANSLRQAGCDEVAVQAYLSAGRS